MAATLWVSTVSYVPYAVFNLLSPLLVIAFASVNMRMLREAKGQRNTPSALKVKQRSSIVGRAGRYTCSDLFVSSAWF